MIDPERIQRLAAKMGNRKDALEFVRQMRCGGKKFDEGGNTNPYTGEIRQGKEWNAVDHWLADRPMLRHRMRKAGTLLKDAALAIPQVGALMSMKDLIENDFTEKPDALSNSVGNAILGHVKNATPMVMRKMGQVPDYLAGYNFLGNALYRVPAGINFIRDFAEPVEKYPDGGKFFRTNLQDESPMMYQPMPPINYPIEMPLRFRPQPDLGDYVPPVSTGMIREMPIGRMYLPTVPETGVLIDEMEIPSAMDLFSDEAVARRALKQRYAESAFNDKARSKAGAQGAWQIMPITLKDYLGRGRGKAGDLNDPEYNRKVRDWVMGIIPRDLQEFWSEDDSDRAKLAKLYAAYNWGAGNLRGFLRKKKKAGVDISNPDNWVDDLNPETRKYVKYLAFDEDIPDSTVYTNAAFEKAAAERGYASGGRIHIKPENRGKFTALKKRTGHSASWFKAHGTPAQKKMAVFELNSRHWGNRKDEGGENLITEYPEGYNGEIRQGKPFNAWDRYLANHPMAGHRLRKTKTLLADAARVHPLTALGMDIYDIITQKSPEDRNFKEDMDIATTALGTAGRTVQSLYGIPAKILGETEFLKDLKYSGKLLAIPDLLMDSSKFITDFAEPVTNFENGGYLLGHVYDLSDEQVNELIRQGYEVERI